MVLSMTNICTRTKQVKTIIICPGLQMLCVPFLPQKQDTIGSAFTISKGLARKCGRVEKYFRMYNLGDHKTSRRVWKLFRFMSWWKLLRHPHGQNLFHEVKLLKDQSICINIISRHKKKKRPRHTADAPLSALKLSKFSNFQCYWAGHTQHTHVIWTCNMILGKG